MITFGIISGLFCGCLWFAYRVCKAAAAGDMRMPAEAEEYYDC